MFVTPQKARDDKGTDGREDKTSTTTTTLQARKCWIGDSHPWPPDVPILTKGRVSASGSGSARPGRRVPTPVRQAISGEWALKECEEHTTWANELLQKNKYPLIGDLRKGLADGVTLVTLTELTTSIPVAKCERHPTSSVHCLENLKRCLTHLEERGVDIAGISAKDIADGNLKSTLILLGNIRKKYDQTYGERSDGDGGVAPPPGEPANQSMPGRLFTEGGTAVSRGPPTPVKRDTPSSVQREVNFGYYSPTAAQRMIPGMIGGEETTPRPSSALPFMTNSDVNNTGVSQQGIRQYTAGQWSATKPNSRPQSAREALGVGSEKPPFHVTNAWASSQRARDLPGQVTEKPPVAPRPSTQRPRQHEDGQISVPPPAHSRNNSGIADNTNHSRQTSNQIFDTSEGLSGSQQRWGIIGGQTFPGYVPSQPNERKDGPRGELLFSRERQPPPYPRDHRMNESHEQYHNMAFAGDNSDDTLRRGDGAVNNDIRSACNKLYGSRSQTPDRQIHGSPAAQTRRIPDINKKPFSPQPFDFHTPSFDQIQHTARASPMGQSSNSFSNLTDTRSYTGQNATFSTFKPESDDDDDDDNKDNHQKGNSVEIQIKDALMPSSKYPSNAGSRPNSARQTPINNDVSKPDERRNDNFHLQGFTSHKTSDYYNQIQQDHPLASTVSYVRETESKPQTSKVAVMMNSTHINAAYVEDSADESDGFRGTTNQNILDYAGESSGSITPPLPPLSPGSSRPSTPPFNPKFGRSYSASNVSPPKTPDLLTSTSKQHNKIRVPEHLRASNLYVDSVGKSRERSKHSPRQTSNTDRTYSTVKKAAKGNGLSHSLDDLRESGNESNISFDIENTFLTVEESEQDVVDNFRSHKHGHASHKHMDKFEAMYQNMLHSVGVVKEASRHKEHVHVKRRWSLASSDTSSLPKGRKFRSDRSSYERGSAKDIKSIQRRFQRLESHVVTLARSVAHLSSELRHNNALAHELDWIKRELRELRLESHHHKNNPFGGRTDKAMEFERFRAWIPSLTNPKRVNKLTKFFGQEPPLLQLYLKKLGYERYAKNFENEHIGMIELPYMTEDRLESIGIPMGPRLRILQEAQLCFRQDNFNIYIV